MSSYLVTKLTDITDSSTDKIQYDNVKKWRKEESFLKHGSKYCETYSRIEKLDCILIPVNVKQGPGHWV